jgi:hypothetical protein
VPGDRLFCYVTGISRWAAVLNGIEGAFHDDTPKRLRSRRPFTGAVSRYGEPRTPHRTRHPDQGRRVMEQAVRYSKLEPGSLAWTGRVRGSLSVISAEDAPSLSRLLRGRTTGGRRLHLHPNSFAHFGPPRPLEAAAPSLSTYSIPQSGTQIARPPTSRASSLGAHHNDPARRPDTIRWSPSSPDGA